MNISTYYFMSFINLSEFYLVDDNGGSLSIEKFR